MPRVLVIGYAPDAVDFSDPALLPGLTVERLAEGIRRDLQLMRDRGWEAENLLIRPEEDLRRRVVDHLSGASYDCIVIGGGVRLASKLVPQLEIVVNAIREGAPQTPIAFNSGPDTSGQAAARWLSQK